MIDQIPPLPDNCFRLKIELNARAKRMDTLLLQLLKVQKENLDLRIISRKALKDLFINGRIQIKGQKARPSSALAKGITYVDILGFKNN